MNELANLIDLVCVVGMAALGVGLIIAVSKIARTHMPREYDLRNVDIEDSPYSGHDYVLPDDLQDLAGEVSGLEHSLAESRRTLWDDD